MKPGKKKDEKITKIKGFDNDVGWNAERCWMLNAKRYVRNKKVQYELQSGTSKWLNSVSQRKQLFAIRFNRMDVECKGKYEKELNINEAGILLVVDETPKSYIPNFDGKNSPVHKHIEHD